MNDNDPYTSEIFESKDPRDNKRRIRITELHPEQADTRGYYDLNGDHKYHTYYRAIRVDEYGNPVGKQRTRITAHTLDTHFRKVSR